MTATALGDAENWPPILSTADAARFLQIHPEYLRKPVREGKVPCHRFPGEREMLFLTDELLDWLRDQPGEDGLSSTQR